MRKVATGWHPKGHASIGVPFKLAHGVVMLPPSFMRASDCAGLCSVGARKPDEAQVNARTCRAQRIPRCADVVHFVRAKVPNRPRYTC